MTYHLPTFIRPPLDSSQSSTTFKHVCVQAFHHARLASISQRPLLIFFSFTEHSHLYIIQYFGQSSSSHVILYNQSFTCHTPLSCHTPPCTSQCWIQFLSATWTVVDAEPFIGDFIHVLVSVVCCLMTMVFFKIIIYLFLLALILLRLFPVAHVCEIARNLQLMKILFYK